MANMLQDPTTGKLLALPPETFESQKRRVIEALEAGKTLGEAQQAAGISYVTLWRRCQEDAELASWVEAWRKGIGLESVAAMHDDMNNADARLERLRSNGYANFRMITAKTAFPDMRDGFKIEFNDNRQVVTTDVDALLEKLDRPAE